MHDVVQFNKLGFKCPEKGQSLIVIGGSMSAAPTQYKSSVVKSDSAAASLMPLESAGRMLSHAACVHGGVQCNMQLGSGSSNGSCVLGKKKVLTVDLVHDKGRIVCVFYDNCSSMCRTVFKAE